MYCCCTLHSSCFVRNSCDAYKKGPRRLLPLYPGRNVCFYSHCCRICRYVYIRELLFFPSFVRAFTRLHISIGQVQTKCQKRVCFSGRAVVLHVQYASRVEPSCYMCMTTQYYSCTCGVAYLSVVANIERQSGPIRTTSIQQQFSASSACDIAWHRWE